MHAVSASCQVASVSPCLKQLPLWEVHPVDFTHIHTDMSATSILDHFLVTERLVPLVDRCTALHLGDNMSRYSPILIA